MLGLAIFIDRQLGDASIIPPTLQKAVKYSPHVKQRPFMAITAFFGKYLVKISITQSISDSQSVITFFLSCQSGLTWSKLRQAVPLPLNSSSILKSHVCTYKFARINFAREKWNSQASQISTELMGVGTSANQKIFFEPDFVLYRVCFCGSPERIGIMNAIESLMSSDEITPGTR